MRAARLSLLLLLALSVSSSWASSFDSESTSASVATQRHLLSDVAAVQPADPAAVTTTAPEILPAGAPPPPPTNAYRISCDLLGNTNVFPPGDLYVTALVRSFARMQADTTGRCGYRQLAGIHGSLRSYDGFTSSRPGFCPHGSQNFIPWHRYYTCHMEACLIQHCLVEAQSFTNATLRDDLTNRVCHLLRMPYWQWTTNPVACRLATATTWPVRNYNGVDIDIVPNPFLRFGSTYRNSNTMSGSCRNRMATFIASRSRNCLYTGASGCTANLEACHNTCHGSIGGSMGNIPTAALDPIFYLHHCFVDLLARQWQVNGGRMMAPGSLRPFGRVYTDAVGITCGARQAVYYIGNTNPYLNGGGYGIGSGPIQSSAQAAGAATAAAEPALVDGAVVAPSAAAREQLDIIMQSLVGDYTGYTWHLALPEVHCGQTRITWTIIAVLKGTRLPRSRGRVDMKALTKLAGYCDQWYAFSCGDPMAESPYVDVTFDLTQCLAATGRNPDVAPKDNSNPLRGPGSVPVKVNDVQLVVLDANKRPMRNFKLPKRTTLSWAYVYNTDALAKDATTSQAAVAAAAAAAGSGGWGVEQGEVEVADRLGSTAAEVSP